MRFFRTSPLEHLAVTMPGVKLGDRVLVAGCGDPHLIASLASKTGLTGRACAVDESPERTTEAARVALADGALIETVTAPLSSLPLDEAAFDIVVLRDVLLADSDEARARIAREARRVLRPGGRCVAIQTMRAGLGRLLRGGSPTVTDAAGAMRALTAAQFRGVRTLAEREGLAFVEGTKAADLPPGT